MAYGRSSDASETSTRSIAPNRVSKSCPLFKGSPPDPPSPNPMYRYPSGPKAMVPPLWFGKGWGTCIITSSLPASTPPPSRTCPVYRATTVSLRVV